MEETGIFVEIKGICRVALACRIFSIIASKHLIERCTVHVDGRTNWKNKPMKRDLTWPVISWSSCSIWFTRTSISYYPLYSSPQGRWWWLEELRSLRPFQRRSLSRCPCSRWTCARKYVFHVNFNLKKFHETKFHLKGRDRVIRPKRIGRTRQPWIKRPRRTVKK